MHWWIYCKSLFFFVVLQLCSMKFGSWTYDGYRVDVQMEAEEADVKMFVTNGEWDLIGVPAQRNEIIYVCCPEPYPDVTFTVHIRRRTKYYYVNLIIPCALITCKFFGMGYVWLRKQICQTCLLPTVSSPFSFSPPLPPCMFHFILQLCPFVSSSDAAVVLPPPWLGWTHHTGNHQPPGHDCVYVDSGGDHACNFWSYSTYKHLLHWYHVWGELTIGNVKRRV